MTTLAAELESLRDILAALPRRRILPANQMRPTRRVLERVLKALDVVPSLPEARLERVRREVIEAQRSGSDLSKLPIRILRDAVWLLWPATPDGVNRPELRRAILTHIGARKLILRRLIDVWLLHFSGDDDSFVEVGRQIDRHLATDHSGMLGRWKDAHRTYDLFNATTGPDQLAARVLQEVSGTLEACHLDSPARASGGFLRAVHYSVSKRLPRLLSEGRGEEIQERAIRFYAPDGRLRFDEKTPNGTMADALVSPWVGNQRQPSDQMRSEVLSFLRQHLGDPRVDTRQRWSSASDGTRRTVRAWLSKLALDAFFNVVGQFAGSEGMNHQWRSREAFWGACLRQNHIRDSWLILGENVARAVSGNHDLRSSYGRLSDGNANHSVLLMLVGNLIFAEWSHNGRLRAWQVDSQSAPHLFRASYSRFELMASGIPFPPPAGRPGLGTTGDDGLVHSAVWQGRVAALLRKKEGINLHPDEWQVR